MLLFSFRIPNNSYIFDMINEDDRNKFLIAWKRSSAAQLLLPDPETSIIELGKEDGFLASIAFIAYERGLLDRLDGIIEKWQIISKGFFCFL